jgi:hypothetical protein
LRRKVRSPVFAGDTIHVECEVIEARPSKSHAGRGLARTRDKTVRHDDTLVIIDSSGTGRKMALRSRYSPSLGCSGEFSRWKLRPISNMREPDDP